MRKLFNIFIALLLLVVLLGSLVTYRVPYNEAVIITRFGRADESSVKNADGNDAGLRFKLPWPIDSVQQRYDRRVQIMDTRLEETLTSDQQGIIVEAYVAWQVRDPLKVLKQIGTQAGVGRLLQDRLRDAKSEISNYRFDQLVSTQEDNRKLAEIEQSMQARLQTALDQGNYGIEIRKVGIRKLVLATGVTEKVFERMRTARGTIANKTIGEGSAQASQINAAADSSATKILSFADSRAARIKQEGERRAAEYYEAFAQNPEFAILLDKLAAFPVIFDGSTIIMPADNPFMTPLLDKEGKTELTPDSAAQPRAAAGDGDANQVR